MTPEEQASLDEMKMRVAQEEEDVGMLEDDLYEQSGPQGRFSKKAMNSLVKAANDVATLFGITDKLPPVASDAPSFPPELLRVIFMFKDAMEDAIEMDMLSEEAMPQLEGISDDAGIMMLAGKLQMAAKDKNFKKFLKKPSEKSMKVEVEVESEEESSPEEMSSDEMDKMFMSRM
jgi:hypothetical protein